MNFLVASRAQGQHHEEEAERVASKDKKDSATPSRSGQDAGKDAAASRDNRDSVVSSEQAPRQSMRAKKEWVIPRCYHIPRKVCSKGLEVVDGRDSPDKPGLLKEQSL